MSDAAGTGWLNVKERVWDDALLQASGLSQSTNADILYEGNQVCGELSERLAKKMENAICPRGCLELVIMPQVLSVWGLLVKDRRCLSLGTSGVYFAVADGFYSNRRYGCS